MLTYPKAKKPESWTEAQSLEAQTILFPSEYLLEPK